MSPGKRRRGTHADETSRAHCQATTSCGHCIISIHLPDLISTLAELRDLDIAFVSLTEALDFTTSAGRAMIGLLTVFAEFERDMIRERVKAGIAQARAEGRKHGRPRTGVFSSGTRRVR